MHGETMIFDEFSLADSKTVGTGYVIDDAHDGSVSMLTDDQEVGLQQQQQQESTATTTAATLGDNNQVVGGSGWNMLNKIFSKGGGGGSPVSSSRKMVRNNSSKPSSNRSNRLSNRSVRGDGNNNDGFEDNILPNYRTDVDFYFNSNYKHSSRRANNRVMFRELSKKTNSQYNINTSNNFILDSTNHNNDNDNDDPPSPAIDFLKDDKSEMTHGRRLALHLMKYKWYNPHADIIEEQRQQQLQLQEKRQSLDLDTSNINVSMFESNQAVVETSGSNIGSGTTRMQEVPSLEKAWAYFEHVTLPRYVKVYKKNTITTTTNDNDNDKNNKNNNKESKATDDEKKKKSNSGGGGGGGGESKFADSCCGGGRGQVKEIAESGERYFQTKLYHPFCTPLNQLGGFGLGIALYFTTLRAVMILLFIAGLVSIPNFLYFSGPEYSNNQENIFWALRGSSVCTEYEFVPCLDCNPEGNFARAEDRLRFATDELGEMVTFALKNNCNGATVATMMTNMATILFVIFGLSFISYYLAKQEDKLDGDVQTAKDYSIVVLNPPSDAGDPVEWRNYFVKKFDNLHVTCCTVAVQNDRLVKALVQRRELLQKIRKTLPPEESSLDKNDLEVVVEDMKEERGCTRCKGLPEYYDKLLFVEERIKELVVDDKPVASVFITFEYESSQRKVLKALIQDARTNEEDRKYPFREGYEPLKVMRASEPSAVRWQDLSEGTWLCIQSLIIPFLVTILLIAASTVAVFFLRRGFWIIPGNPMYASFAISVGNFLFPTVAKALTNMEVHRREGHKQTSLYIKNAIFRWINTVVVLALVMPFTSTVTPGEDNLLYGVYSIFFTEIVVTTSLGFLDIWPNLQRHVFAPRAKTQEDMNNYMGGREIDLAERYTTLTKILLLTVWFCSLYPLVLFFGAFAVLLLLITDKFCLMRSWAPSPRLGSTISKINRKYFFSATSIIVIVIASYAWTGFTFDNLCAVDEGVNIDSTYEYEIASFDNNETTVVTIDSETQIYRYCEQNLIEKGFFPAGNPFFKEEFKWMSAQQKLFTEIYGWLSLAVIAVIASFVAYNIGYNMRKDKSSNSLEVNKTPFHASGVNVRAYIPEVNSDAIPYPLVACSVKNFDSKLFDWESPYRSHDYYDLTLDAEDIMEEEDEIEIADMAFSKVRYWEHVGA